jgi:hypothetical protein
MPAPYWEGEPDPDSSLRFRFLESVFVLGAATASIRFRAIFAYTWLDGCTGSKAQPAVSVCSIFSLPQPAPHTSSMPSSTVAG